MDITERFKLHKLIVLRTIGKGTYGNVYLCEKRTKKSLTVVKDIELNTKLQNHNKEIANEIKILATMNHPNIIKFYNCYYEEKHVMICMEYAMKGNLAEYMFERCPNLIKQTEILFYFSQILLGVRYIHNLDIIHRDLKAENILLTGTHGVIVKIGDFGISKMLASAKKTSTVIGTPYYLAPELCEGKPYDTKSDVWALGCLLYEMCTHKRAFDSEELPTFKKKSFDVADVHGRRLSPDFKPFVAHLPPFTIKKYVFSEALFVNTYIPLDKSFHKSLVGLVKMITEGNVRPIDMTVYDRGLQDLIDSMLSVIPDKRPTIKELLGRPILLPTVYTVYLDAGNDELLYSKFCKCF